MNFAIIFFISALILLFFLCYQIFQAKKLKEGFELQVEERRLLNIEKISLEEKIQRSKSDFEKRLEIRRKEYESVISTYKNKIKGMELELESQLNLIEEMMDLFDKSINMESTTIMKISSFYSDFILTSHVMSQRYLEQKKRPALKEAMRIQEVIVDSKRYLEAYRLMCYKYEYMLTIFPELTYYLDDFESIGELEKLIKEPSSRDSISTYLNKEERGSLPEIERNQLAFERYLKRKKSNWELGRDYELFCGIELEKDGWAVEYHGIEKKLLDFGRDLIATKGEEILIVQCKYWAKYKVIHEKHIFQLFGSMMEFQINSKSTKVNAMIITNTNLSDTAKKVSDLLGIRYIENKPLSDFPRIKCNINKDEFGATTKIYHLPFDQQYDTTRIQNIGECYAWDVYDAERKGFRRAKRFYGFL